MKYATLLLFTLFGFHFAAAQIQGKILDAHSKEAIPYVNIWIEHTNNGTTSDINGHFEIDSKPADSIIVFSAVGYETSVFPINRLKDSILLHPFITELSEITVTPQIGKLKTTIDKFKKRKINHYFACGTVPWMLARKFEFKQEYKKTPFLDRIKILTRSEKKDAVFHIRIYDVNEDGEPGSPLHEKNIIGKARKGKKYTKVDLDSLQIKFPEGGLFIAFEWLIIDENKSEHTYSLPGSLKKKKSIRYNPMVGTMPSKETQKHWVYRGGKWSNMIYISKPQKDMGKVVNLLAIELRLSN